MKSVDGKEIQYGTNPLNPKSWNGNIYTFEGRRLTSCNYCSYTYDDQGLRIKKKVNGTITNFYYDGTKLITEINPSYRLDFIYDENNQLYGLIYNNTDKYFYVRDILQNILGIIDSSGNLVVKYGYTAYGEITSTLGTKATTIGKYNPFRWKGYYYDEETGLYLVTTRYYNPEWCRWLNGDSTAYLNPQDINGMNLFSYCNNNPVMYVDPNGNLAFLLLCGLIGAGIGLICGGTYAGLKAYESGNRGWNLVGNIALGGLIGGTAGFVIGALVGGCISGALTGSFLSSCSAVKTGAILVYNMAKVGGIGAAGYMMLDNMSNAFHYTPHVFWSGGDLSMNGSKYLDNDMNGTTLEMTRLGSYLTDNNAIYEAWKLASINFAGQVPNGGTILSMQNLNGIGISSTWATIEYPILVKKGVEIIYELIGRF